MMSVIKLYSQQTTKNSSAASVAKKEIARGATTMEMEEKEMTEKVKQKPQANPYKDAKIEVKVIDNTASIYDSNIGGYGYDIYLNDVLFLHQPNIPAVSGNNGFKTKAVAQKAGEIVANKIRSNSTPPGLTLEEINSLLNGK